MKLLSNKTYQGIVDAYNGLLEENKKLKVENRNLKHEQFGWVKITDNFEKRLKQQETKIGELNTKIASSKNKNVQLEDENRQLKEENKKLLGAKGGYIKEINKLKKQIEELDFKLKESMTDKYLIKKLPSGRKPKTQTMKLTSHTVVSNITRKMHNNN